MFNNKKYDAIMGEIPAGVQLVAVSKFFPIVDLQSAYEHGVHVFGESRPQELCEKWEALPCDIEWHMIGHLQTNKVKLIAPFVALIHSVDSVRLAKAIDKEAAKIGRVIPVLLQLHVAQEETKQGFSPSEIVELLEAGVFQAMKNIEIRGIMAMATLTDNTAQIGMEFAEVRATFEQIKARFLPRITEISMGMSSDYPLAVAQGATMIRVGSLLFGNRQ